MCVLLTASIALPLAAPVRPEQTTTRKSAVRWPSRAIFRMARNSTSHLKISSLYGKKVFEARFTAQEGVGRPLTKGAGAPLSDPSSPLSFPRNNNRLSGPESNSCAGCQPISGGTGDLSTNVFVLGQRFDFATFNANDTMPTRGTMDEPALPLRCNLSRTAAPLSTCLAPATTKCSRGRSQRPWHQEYKLAANENAHR